MRKKLMILLVVTLFITMMFSTGCKKAFDITGTWTINYQWTGAKSGSIVFTFTGDKKSGDLLYVGKKFGTYSVNGKNVTFMFIIVTYTGTSTDDNNMSGTFRNTANQTGTWTAVRQ